MSEANVQKTISKKSLRKSFWIWNSMAQAVYSFERMQAPGFVTAMSPVVDDLYPDTPENKEARIEMATRHMEFYNTEIWLLGGLVVGLVASMEEGRANGLPINGEDISGVKTSLMGPLAGIGDTLRQGTLIPIIGSIAISLGLTGNFLGPIIYMVFTLAINYGINWGLFKTGYSKGKEGIQQLVASNKLEKYMTLATTIGGIAIGGLAATTVKVKTIANITLGQNKLVLQEILDKIIPGLLPLCFVMFTYYMLTKKKMSTTKMLLILIAIAIVGGLIGLF